ncbi:helix-turn-helix transcriptional regulator [Leptolyngbya sp. NK1-12]|uniref:Helix-turn-helix transcriptional regulator n=2 Tax=Leptolyngbya sp. NK1-12 TaxID=2547451 RepID=A0AA97ARZ6_9CYAN|nr:helix-turn-helix transcriptional regulator [Elainella sp. C42_A2020_010]RNJ69914.1 MAG: XRE family transcriptional regulator [Leptolyngbya sp. IPPAS B-1204]WNZ26208.1 helix-turn-helix transcriptional regulator [Leptolyngbya sp. NK1-12]
MKRMRCRLRVLMAEKEITQIQLRESLGLGSNTISKLYNNRFDRVDRETIEKLCDYFGVEIGDLFTLKDEE